jgi:HK97 family phage major capsid protein
MTDISMNEVNEALKDLRCEFDKKSQDLGKIEKIESILAKNEEDSQELTKSLKEAEKKSAELEERYNSLEAEVKRVPLCGDADEEKKAELKAFESFIVKGEDFLGEAEKKYLRTDVNSDGGYLVPVQQESEIIKQITEISPIRNIAKVRTMGAKTMRMPVRSALVAGGWVGEGEQDSLSNSTYGNEELTAKGLQVTVQITRHELQDATPNMVAEIGSDVAESFAQVEGAAFVNGDGSEKPEGFMFDSRVGEINSGDAGNLTFDSLISVTGEIKTGYSPVYGFNRKTLAVIRGLKDGASNYVWRQGNLGAGIPNSIMGSPYVEIPDMPDIAASAYPVIYGDFSKGYLIGDRLGMNVIRDDFTQKRKSIVEFTYLKRLDGQVVLPEAFKKIKIST